MKPAWMEIPRMTEIWSVWGKLSNSRSVAHGRVWGMAMAHWADLPQRNFRFYSILGFTTTLMASWESILL